MSSTSELDFSGKTTDFAFDLFRQILTDNLLKNPSKVPENLVFSPTSISLALALAERGAKGKTRSQISQKLFGSLQNDYNETFIGENLIKLNQIFNQKHDDLILNLANGLFVDEKFKLLPNYLLESRQIFETEPESVTFAENREKAVQRINEWVKEKTNGKIEKLFDQLDPMTQLVIANAIYFKGAWAKPFLECNTQKSDFHVNNTKTVRIDFMNQYNKHFEYNCNDQMQVLSLPYKKDQLEMVFILPRQRFGLAQLLESLNGVEFWKIIYSTENKAVDVTLPKFKMENSFGLVDVLKQLGIIDIFSAEADLSLISESHLSVSDVVHKVFLEITEEGAEAAAVTAIGAVGCSLEEGEPPHFKANEPFLLAIVERNTSSVLFLGHFYG